MQGKFLVAALMQAGRDLPQTSAKRHGHNVNIEGSILLVRVSLVLLQHPSAALGILLLLQLPFELVRNALRCTSHDAESIWVGVNTQGGMQTRPPGCNHHLALVMAGLGWARKISLMRLANWSQVSPAGWVHRSRPSFATAFNHQRSDVGEITRDAKKVGKLVAASSAMERMKQRCGEGEQAGEKRERFLLSHCDTSAMLLSK